MNDPAVWSALSIRLARKPSVSPTATWTATAPINDGVSRLELMWGANRGAAASARAALTPILTWAGIMRLLNGGAITTHALARTSASRNATTSPAGRSMVNGRAESRRDETRDHGEQVMGEPDDLVQHPVAGHHDDDGDRGQLGHESQRHFLDLGDRLEQRDGQTDGEAGDEDRGRDLGRHHHHLDRDLDNRGVVHCATSSR